MEIPGDQVYGQCKLSYLETNIHIFLFGKRNFEHKDYIYHIIYNKHSQGLRRGVGAGLLSALLQKLSRTSAAETTCNFYMN